MQVGICFKIVYFQNAIYNYINGSLPGCTTKTQYGCRQTMVNDFVADPILYCGSNCPREYESYSYDLKISTSQYLTNWYWTRMQSFSKTQINSSQPYSKLSSSTKREIIKLDRLRFSAVWHATQLPNICIQKPSDKNRGQISEDCLYLNIYAHLRAKTDDSLLPVFVYIHGGLFTMGSGSPLDASYVVGVSSNMIVVTLNYRLGPFGYM